MDIYSVSGLLPIAGLLEKLIDEVGAKKRRRHEERIKIINMIADSKLRDAYVHQILINKFFLDSSENAQKKVQNAAKHSQYLADHDLASKFEITITFVSHSSVSVAKTQQNL